MESAVETLFNFLRDTLYRPAEASLDVENLPDSFQDLGHGLLFFAKCVTETKALAQALSKGNLNETQPSRDNEIAAPLKALCASLRHLTWQAQQIAKGDYKQRVDFMGDFSAAFNEMVFQLAERQQTLENTINQIEAKAAALEQGNMLLDSLMHHVPLQIIVLERDSDNLLLLNVVAEKEASRNPSYIKDILRLISEAAETGVGETEIKYAPEGQERYFLVKTYTLEWNNTNAQVLTLNDISDTKNRMEVLETRAYKDVLTDLYNRAFAMAMLDKLLVEKQRFVLVFADLDNLKYINDEFGHSEGDLYIINAAKHLKTFAEGALTCRIGGDEFMTLAPNMGYDEAHAIMNEIFKNLQQDEFLHDKTYQYNISFGIAAVEPDNTLEAGEILSIADERMYANKRMRKKLAVLNKPLINGHSSQ